MHSPTTGTNCDTLIRSYAVQVNGAPIPAWMTLVYADDNSAPYITVSTSDTTLNGIYTVVITGSVNTNPVTYSDEPLTFTVTISNEECVLYRLDSAVVVPDITFEIDSHSAASEITWDDFCDTRDSGAADCKHCGKRFYDLPEQHLTPTASPGTWGTTDGIPQWLTFDGKENKKELSVFTTDPT